MNNRPDHIAIVDDDPDIRRLLGTALEPKGYRVTTLERGEELWDLMEKSRVDLVVLDLGLPGEDGLDVCRNLRARSGIPILILTARSEEVERIIGVRVTSDQRIAVAVGVDHHVDEVGVLERLRRARVGVLVEFPVGRPQFPQQPAQLEAIL